MANPVFLTDEDLWRRVGGQDKLTQLLDPQGTGTWDPGTAEIARADASNRVLAAAGVQAEHVLDVTEFRDKYPHLVTVGAQLAICLLWEYGSSGQALPQHLADRKTQVNAELSDIQQRRLKQGSVSFNPVSGQRIASGVSLDPNSDRLSLASWKASGFC
mgnify:CR=1 FL=1